MSNAVVIEPNQENTKRVWEAKSLITVIQDLVLSDKMMVGLSKYLPKLKLFWSTQIPTACAGHGFIFFNPNFWESIPEETGKTVVAHEIWHIILRHLERGEGYDPEAHNIAADHVINLILKSEGFTFEGTEPYCDPKYTNMSTEEVYNDIIGDILKNRKKPKPDRCKIDVVSKDTIDGLVQDALDELGKFATVDDQAKKNDQNLAKDTGLTAGNSPGERAIVLHAPNPAKPIKLDAKYEDIFANYLIDPLSSGRRTYMRPSRRTSPFLKSKNVLLPGKLKRPVAKNRLQHLIYALDVSGSITSEMAQQSHKAIGAIKTILNPASLTVLYFDTRIVREKTFTEHEDYTEITVRAGGGTSLGPVYKRAAELGTDALVILTDLMVSFPPEPKEWDTIWLVPSIVKVPQKLTYGEIYLVPE